MMILTGAATVIVTIAGTIAIAIAITITTSIIISDIVIVIVVIVAMSFGRCKRNVGGRLVLSRNRGMWSIG